MKWAFLVAAVGLVALRLWRHRLARARKVDRGAGAPEADAPEVDTPGVDAPVPGAPGRLWRSLDAFGGDVGLVARREMRERMRGRTFRIATAVILLAVAAAVTIPVLRRGSHAHERVGIVGAVSAPLRATVVAAGPAVGTKVTLVDEPSLAAASRDLRSGRVAVVLVDSRRLLVDQALDPTSTSSTSLLVRVLSSTVSLQAGLESAGIAPARAAELAHPPPLAVGSLQAPKRNETARSTSVYGLIITYVLLSTYGAWLLMGVVEEKASRVVEVLLSTLRPGQLLAGKVIGIGTVALLQAALIVAVALGLGAAVGSDLLHGTAALEVVGALVWTVLGYAFYCWVYAAAGSLADRQEQVQSLAFPLQLPILFGYIVSFTALGSGGASTLVRVLAFVPLTAPFCMPVLVGLGQATWWQFALSVALMVLATVAVARAAAAVYGRAILRTGGRVRLRQVLGTEAP